MVDENYAQQRARWQAEANARNQQQAAAAQEFNQGLQQWRQQYDQQERQNRLQNIRADAATAERERNEALQAGDFETAELRDRDLRELAADWRQLNPPVQQRDPRAVEYVRRRAGHFQKPGAIAEADLAHQYITRPRHPNPTPQAVGSGQHGCGIQAGSPRYFRMMDDLQQMYGTKNFDPNGDVLPGEHEAAKIAGLSLDEYKKAAQEVQRQGRFSWQERK